MKWILFKKELLNKVQLGQKKSTLRLRKLLNEDDEFNCISGKTRVKARVLNMRKLTVKDLTAEIAIKEGFRTKDELIEVLNSIYGSQNIKTKMLYYYEFELI